MKVLKIVAILIFSPVLGAVAGFVIATLILLVANPSSVLSNDGSPGEGFLAIPCILVCLLISIPVSWMIAAKVWNSDKNQSKLTVD